MIKKIFGLVVVAVMVLGIFGLAACTQCLAEYKAEAKAEIENYAQESGYFGENWQVICGIVSMSKNAIDAAEDKSAVDMAVKDAKEAMDEVKNQLKHGIYATDDKTGHIELYGESSFSFSIVYMSFLPTGKYSIKDGNLVLNYSDTHELVFEIGCDQLIFTGANIEGVFAYEGPVKVGTIFKLTGGDDQQ